MYRIALIPPRKTEELPKGEVENGNRRLPKVSKRALRRPNQLVNCIGISNGPSSS
jgi:hypothetical protein